MRRVLSAVGLVLIFVVVLCLASLALAQDAVMGVPSVDLGAWGRDLFSFALPITFLVAHFKRAGERRGWRVPPVAWWTLAVVLGVAGAFGLHGGGFGAELRVYGAEYPVSVVLFGVLAGFVAAGFRDFVKGAVGWRAVSRVPAVPDAIQQTEIHPVTHPAFVEEGGP